MAAIIPTPANTAFNTVCKLAFVPLAREEDESPIWNIGALRIGLEALAKEDASDHARARELWAEAKLLLVAEIENEVGASAQGSVQMDDSFEMECFPVGL